MGIGIWIINFSNNDRLKKLNKKWNKILNIMFLVETNINEVINPIPKQYKHCNKVLKILSKVIFSKWANAKINAEKIIILKKDKFLVSKYIIKAYVNNISSLLATNISKNTSLIKNSIFLISMLSFVKKSNNKLEKQQIKKGIK